MVSVLDADWSRQRRSYAKVTDFLKEVSYALLKEVHFYLICKHVKTVTF